MVETRGTIQLQGFKECSDALVIMARSVGGRILKKALYKSATVIRDDAIRRAPEDTGRLKQFIGRSGGRVKTGDDRFQATVLVGLIRLTKAQQRKTGLTQDAYYGKFVEFGTRFQRAEPFLRPAFDSQKENFIDAFGEELWTLITTALETKSAPSEGA